MQFTNLTERDYIEAKQSLYDTGSNLNLVIDPETMDISGSAEHLQLFEAAVLPIIDKRVKTEAKKQGFIYNGIQCSATSEDQHGLADIMVLFTSNLATSVNFHLENGNTLALTPENIEDFGAAFFAFRNQFFT